ncbi:hypothetical protein AA2016_6269 (plasmid) [Aminobacter aminovorans]|jgi:hypothetical protein|uniref:Uncharacterized protein n=1 Tax=Aminobacter aminovorans TaxID=83263 RepID=A0AAC8YVE0_AMIAI|nr:hypothetical protein AA2016_6269 [Aminobacter aminovorans]
MKVYRTVAVAKMPMRINRGWPDKPGLGVELQVAFFKPAGIGASCWLERGHGRNQAINLSVGKCLAIP